MNARASAPLAGIGVLLTRPAAQAVRTAEALRNAGAEVFLFPALEIVTVDSNRELEAALAALARAHMAIFVSANAVEHGIALVKDHGGFSSRTRIAAIGEATRKALELHGIANALTPAPGYDSEALLAHPDLQQVAGQLMIIFRGHSEGGGRRLLGDTLLTRGASVVYAECYRRALPRLDAHARARLLQHWDDGEIDAVQVMSVETLHNLFALLGEEGAKHVRAAWLVVPHERIARAARDLNCAKIVVAGPDMNELLVRLIGLKASNQLPHAGSKEHE